MKRSLNTNNSKIIKIYAMDYVGKKMTPDSFQEGLSIDNSWNFMDCEESPDLILYHCDKKPQNKYLDILRIKKRWGFAPFLLMMTGEFYPYKLLNADYNISYRPDSKKNFYLIFIITDKEVFQKLLVEKIPPEVKKRKKYPKNRFCNFIYSNYNVTNFPESELRAEFCRMLSGYKKVDCAGKVMNNTDELKNLETKLNHYYLAKLEFQKQYKFSIAFENKSAPGYITEKIWHAFLSGTIPIYRGCPNIGDFFNPASFINCHDYSSFDDVIDRLKEIDSNPKLFEEYINAPPILPCSRFHNYYNKARMAKKMEHLMNTVVSKRERYKNIRFIKIYNTFQWFLFYLVNIRRIIQFGRNKIGMK